MLHASKSRAARTGRRTRPVAVGSFRSYAYGEAGEVRMNDWQWLQLKVRLRAACARPEPCGAALAPFFAKDAKNRAPPRLSVHPWP
jgi:hypothetical protein